MKNFYEIQKAIYDKSGNTVSSLNFFYWWWIWYYFFLNPFPYKSMFWYLWLFGYRGKSWKYHGKVTSVKN